MMDVETEPGISGPFLNTYLVVMHVYVTVKVRVPVKPRIYKTVWSNSE